MSWLARSIANSLKLDDDDDVTADDQRHHHQSNPTPNPSSTSPLDSPRGVREDLTELKQTLTRQLWGVASFLAPPPDPPKQQPRAASAGSGGTTDDVNNTDEDLIVGIRSDFAEIGGRFKSGISKLSNNKAVWEFTKMATNFLQIGSDEELIGKAIGVTEEVVVFARNIAMHPETWLDFPLNDVDNDTEDSDEFDLSDAQQEHALAIERLAPRLAALRMELCPEHMSDSSFWKTYFVLLHPRLSKEDAELLSTPQILEARAMLMQELRNRNKSKEELDLSAGDTAVAGKVGSSHEENLSPPSDLSGSASHQTSANGESTSVTVVDMEKEKHPTEGTEIQIIDKPVLEEVSVDQKKDQLLHATSSSRVVDDKYGDDGDDWLKEETPEIPDVKGTTIHIENDEDVSFSDLEDDDGDVPTTYKKATYGSDSSARDSRDWVQLGGSSDDSSKDINVAGETGSNKDNAALRKLEIKDSNDWEDFDDIDEV